MSDQWEAEDLVLLSSLTRILHDDPPPRRVHEDARAAFAWRDLAAQIALLEFDSAVDDEGLARVRAGLRRSARGTVQTSMLKLGSVQIDLARRVTHGPEGSIHLTPLEYRVLECLARQTGMVVRQGQLLREVWGPDRQYDARSLRVCIKSLRDKLEPDPRRPHFLVTETGLGYRLCTDDIPHANKPPA